MENALAPGKSEALDQLIMLVSSSPVDSGQSERQMLVMTLLQSRDTLSVMVGMRFAGCAKQSNGQAGCVMDVGGLSVLSNNLDNLLAIKRGHSGLKRMTKPHHHLRIRYS